MRDLGEPAIPARVMQREPAEVLSLVENTQREDLDALELAEALHRLAAKGWDRLALARLVNRSVTWVGDVLSLNGLPESIKAEYPEVRRIVARSLLVEIARAKEPEAQAALWAEAKGGALTRARGAAKAFGGAARPAPRAVGGAALREAVRPAGGRAGADAEGPRRAAGPARAHRRAAGGRRLDV